MLQPFPSPPSPLPAGFRAHRHRLGTVPANISGLVLQLDANYGVYTDAGTTLATDGQSVQQWNDRSSAGSNASQGTAGNRPVFKVNIINGKPVVRFTAASSHYMLANGAAAFAQGSDIPFTVFIVGSVTAASGTQSWCGWWNSGNATPLHVLRGNTVTQYRLESTRTDDAASATNASASTVLVGTSAQLYTIRFNGTTVDLTAGLTTSNQAQNVGTIAAFDRFAIGALVRTTVANFLDGDIAELLVYNAALSNTDVLTIQRSLSRKYSLGLAA